MDNRVISNTILIQAIIFVVFAVGYAFKGDTDKWFERWALAMVLFALYGIMKELSNQK